jgi:hypothetical protein
VKRKISGEWRVDLAKEVAKFFLIRRDAERLAVHALWYAACVAKCDELRIGLNLAAGVCVIKSERENCDEEDGWCRCGRSCGGFGCDVADGGGGAVCAADAADAGGGSEVRLQLGWRG